jgi:hypothetical protein
VSCCRFWWDVGHEGHLQELKLKVQDQRKGYAMKNQEVVGLTVQRICVTWNYGSVQVYPFSCGEITF